MIISEKTEGVCFIILPGFAISSMPVEPVENYIRNLGYQVFSSNFWGDQEVEDFSKLTINDCVEGIHALVQRVKQQTDQKIIGLGVSLGGALFIEYAKRYKDLDYIVSLGTPFKLKNRTLIGAGTFIMPLIKNFWSKTRQMLILDSSRTIVHFFENEFLEGFEKVTTQILFLHSKKDRITYFSALTTNIPKFTNSETELIVFEDGDHVINYDAKIIFSSILKAAWLQA